MPELPSIHSKNGLDENLRSRVITVNKTSSTVSPPAIQNSTNRNLRSNHINVKGSKKDSDINGNRGRSYNPTFRDKKLPLTTEDLDNDLVMLDPLQLEDITKSANENRQTTYSPSNLRNTRDNTDSSSSYQTLTKNSTITNSVTTLMIIDTNFFLSHLNTLDKLRELHNQYGHILVVPMVVIYELDHLKKSTKITKSYDKNGSEIRDSPLSQLASRANDWIYKCLANLEPGIRGQKLEEVVNPSMKGDDSILDCMRYFQKTTGAFVVLLSNDKNLCLKAMTHSMPAISYRPGMTALEIASKTKEEYIFKTKEQELNMSYSSSTREHIHETTYDNSESMDMELDDTYSDYEDIEESTITHDIPGNMKLDEASDRIYSEILEMAVEGLEKCLKSAYGDDEDTLSYFGFRRSEVFSMLQVSETLIQFWLSVFSEHFPPHVPKPFTIIQHGGSRKEHPVMTDLPQNKPELEEFIKFWSPILLQLLGEGRRDDVISATEQWRHIVSQL